LFKYKLYIVQSSSQSLYFFPAESIFSFHLVSQLHRSWKSYPEVSPYPCTLKLHHLFPPALPSVAQAQIKRQSLFPLQEQSFVMPR